MLEALSLWPIVKGDEQKRAYPLSIKMDVNETMNKYLFRIKDLRDNLGDIGEEVSSTKLVSIKLKCLFSRLQSVHLNPCSKTGPFYIYRV